MNEGRFRPSPRLRVSIGSWKGRVHVPPCPAGLGASLDVRRFVGEGPDALREEPHPGAGCPSSGVGLERHWFAVVPLVETERLLRITRTQDLLFAQTSYARMHTFDAETGRLLWTADLGERSGFARGVASNSWAVFATNANMLYALDRGSGRPIWREQPRHVSDEYAGLRRDARHGGHDEWDDQGVQPEVRRFQGERAHPRHGFPACGATTRAARSARVRCRPRGWSPSAAGDNKVWVTMADEPTILFRIATGGPIGEGLAGYGTRTLLVPSGDKILYAFDLFTARRLWTFAIGCPHRAGADGRRSGRLRHQHGRRPLHPRPHDRRAAMDRLHPGRSPGGRLADEGVPPIVQPRPVHRGSRVPAGSSPTRRRPTFAPG